MNISSKDFEIEGQLPEKFTCDGDNISPQLEWSDVPEDTKSFAILFQSYGKPVGQHKLWLICDIPKDVREIPQNGPVPGRLILNDFGWKGYSGPCPSQGSQIYYFNVYALNVETLEGVGVLSGKKQDLGRQNFTTSVNKTKITYAKIKVKYAKK